jgi:hypothetical protein
VVRCNLFDFMELSLRMKILSLLFF